MQTSILGKRVFYEIQGSGPPCILVHGWGGTKHSLEPLAKLLSNHLTTITVDLPGFGESDSPEPDWAVEEYAKVITDLLDYLGYRSVIYFGHSFGGSLGIYLAATTSYIQTLILCNSSYKRDQRISKIIMFVKSVVPIQSTFFRRLFYKIFYRNSDIARYPQLEPNLRKIVKHDLTPYVKNVKAKTLIVWGENDQITPVSFAFELHKEIPKSKLIIIPNARHGLPLRNPELVYDAVITFLKP